MKTKVVITLALSSLFLTSCKEEPVVYEYLYYWTKESEEGTITPKSSKSLKEGWEIFSIQSSIPSRNEWDSTKHKNKWIPADIFVVMRRPVK